VCEIACGSQRGASESQKQLRGGGLKGARSAKTTFQKLRLEPTRAGKKGNRKVNGLQKDRTWHHVSRANVITQKKGHLQCTAGTQIRADGVVDVGRSYTQGTGEN